MPYKITYDATPEISGTSFLWQGISDYAHEMKNQTPGKSFAFFIKDELSNLKGGIFGYIFYDCLYVDLLYIDKSLRGMKYGTRLMNEAELLAIKNNCHFMTVNTMDWEAPEFYKKLGFYVEFERKGYAKNSTFYFLRKNLDVSSGVKS